MSLIHSAKVFTGSGVLCYIRNAQFDQKGRKDQQKPMTLISDTSPEYTDRLTVFSTVAISGMKDLPIGSSITILKDTLAQSTPIPVEHWSSIKKPTNWLLDYYSEGRTSPEYTN